MQIALSLNQAKANAADVDKILRDTTPTTFGGGEQTRAVRDHEIHAAESLATAIGIFDEAKVGVVEAQTRMPSRVRPHRQFDDLPPTGGEVRRIRRLDLRCGAAAHDVGADGGLPIPACGKPGAIQCFTTQSALRVSWVMNIRYAARLQ